MTAVDDESVRAPVAGWRRALHWLLLVGAVAFLAHYLVGQWSALGPALSRYDTSTLLAATAVIAAMLALKAGYHVLALRRLGQERTPGALAIASAYAMSQVVRYLPGKVLGVVFEINRLAPSVPATRVVAANVVQSLYTLALTVGVLAAAAAWFRFGATAGAAAVLGVFAVLYASHRLHILERMLQRAAAFVPRLRHAAAQPLPSARASLPASLLLFAEWVPFFVFWMLMLPGSDTPVGDAVLLGCCYAGAALAASFAVLTPSGLFVREAIFLWAGSQLAIEPALLIVQGLLSRLVLTVADLAVAGLAWLLFVVVARRPADA
jgi:hypothetical protein